MVHGPRKMHEGNPITMCAAGKDCDRKLTGRAGPGGRARPGMGRYPPRGGGGRPRRWPGALPSPRRKGDPINTGHVRSTNPLVLKAGSTCPDMVSTRLRPFYLGVLQRETKGRELKRQARFLFARYFPRQRFLGSPSAHNTATAVRLCNTHSFVFYRAVWPTRVTITTLTFSFSQFLLFGSV